MRLSLAFVVAAFTAVSIAPALAQVQNPGNGHWYELVNLGYSVSWNQADSDASNHVFMGAQGHLATISDQSENDFVLGVAPVESWIGLWQDQSHPAYSEPAGGWSWVTGEPLIYTNWAANEPNDAGGIENFSEMQPWGGTWNDEGASPVRAYVIEYEPIVGTAYCFGDPGSGAPCPCDNDNGGSVPGSGCANGIFAQGARLQADGAASVGQDSLVLITTRVEPNETGLYFQADSAVNDGNGVTFGDGLRCAGGGLVRLQVRTANGIGTSITDIPLASKGGVSAGDTRYYQYWYRNPSNSPCGSEFNLSNGYEITWWP